MAKQSLLINMKITFDPNIKLRDCLNQSDSIVNEMQATVDAFKLRHRLPCQLYLSLQKLQNGAVYLRWRKTGIKGKQPYVELDEITLNELPRPLQQSCLNFQQMVLYLNFRHAAVQAEKKRVMNLITQVKQLKEIAGQYSLSINIKPEI